jgi:hypothetical protein
MKGICDWLIVTTFLCLSLIVLTNLYLLNTCLTLMMYSCTFVLGIQSRNVFIRSKDYIYDFTTLKTSYNRCALLHVSVEIRLHLLAMHTERNIVVSTNGLVVQK